LETSRKWKFGLLTSDLPKDEVGKIVERARAGSRKGQANPFEIQISAPSLENDEEIQWEEVQECAPQQHDDSDQENSPIIKINKRRRLRKIDFRL